MAVTSARGSNKLLRTHAFHSLISLSKCTQSCLTDEYIWKEASKSLWWATHMNLEGISKAQRGERCPSLLARSIARVPLPLQKVSVGDLLWKTPILGLSIAHHFRHPLTLPQKPNTWVYAYLSIGVIHTEEKKNHPQCSVHCFLHFHHQPSEPSMSIMPFSFGYALRVCWQCKVVLRWYSGLRQRRIASELGVIVFFKTPNLHIWRGKETEIIRFTLDILPDNFNPVKCPLMTWI